MRKILMVSCLLAIPAVAAAQSLGWQKYAVPETGANVDLPMTIFSKDAGQSEGGYGRRSRQRLTEAYKRAPRSARARTMDT
jgi:hypothetical protein